MKRNNRMFIGFVALLMGLLSGCAGQLPSFLNPSMEPVCAWVVTEGGEEIPAPAAPLFRLAADSPSGFGKVGPNETVLKIAMTTKCGSACYSLALLQLRFAVYSTFPARRWRVYDDSGLLLGEGETKDDVFVVNPGTPLVLRPAAIRFLYVVLDTRQACAGDAISADLIAPLKWKAIGDDRVYRTVDNLPVEGWRIEYR